AETKRLPGDVLRLASRRALSHGAQRVSARPRRGKQQSLLQLSTASNRALGFELREMTGFVLSTVLFLAPPDGPSRILLPEQQIPLSCSHALHLKKNIACEYCHEKAPESTSASDFLIPKEESCTDCHPIDHKQPEKKAKVAARCDACHPGYRPEMGENVARVVIPAPHLKFNHKIHD